MGLFHQFSRGYDEYGLRPGRWLQRAAGVTHAAWANWFYDVAWDARFVLLHRHSRRVWLLCVADPD